MEPERRSYMSQRLRLNYVVWGAESRPPVLLVHGGRDHARNWDFVAAARGTAFHCYRSVQIKNAGHWVHHDQLQAFLDVLLPFLRGDS
jgi:pimeloyl-ACP methyl ester carboxylesterase